MFLAVRSTCDGFTVASLGHESASRAMSAALFGRPSATRQALHYSSAVHIRDLLDGVLATMGLSGSLKNCSFLIDQLKALSGRLAMRLTTTAGRSGELVALAMVYANCAQSEPDNAAWLSLREGFFVPVDDVPDLAPANVQVDGDAEGAGAVRSDLIYVSSGSRGGLSFTFVEVKYRRHLRMARDPQLLSHIANQVESHQQQWTDWYFAQDVQEITGAVRRSRLVRALRFYADKASRHCLSRSRYESVLKELDTLLTQGTAYRFSEPNSPTLGYVFSPEVWQMQPELLSTPRPTSTYLFGPSQLPDLVAGMPTPPKVQSEYSTTDDAEKSTAILKVPTPTASSTVNTEPAVDSIDVSDAPVTTSTDVDAPAPTVDVPTNAARIILGRDTLTDSEVAWTVSSRANPHLMVVGLPGMGKTECLLNICKQLVDQSIVPIVFSYHPDIDSRLSATLKTVRLLDHQDLGFNPMHIDTPAPHAHIDSAGMLRDIFAALFTDLGDVQLERVRQAIKQSYTARGWGQQSEERRETPEFREFFALLQHDPKPDRNLLARLNELDDYGVFRTDGGVRSLLDASDPSIIRIHATQNEMVQRATAMLSLYNIYKEMFRRGVQSRITHAIVFDEAHRASRLKLLPRLAVECRKFGLSLVLASQSSRDFDTTLFSGIASYLLLRMTEQDASALARNITTSDQSRRVADRLKQLEKYHALFVREGHRQPTYLTLCSPDQRK